MGRKILLHGEANLDLQDNAWLASVARAWFIQAAARLFPRLQQLADQGAPEVVPVITVAPTMDDRAKSSPYSPQRWQATLDELGRRPSAVGFDILDANAERESLLARVDMSYATTDGRWISLTADVAASPVDIDDPAFCRSWVELFRAVLDPADPAFGYVTTDNRFPGHTDLDLVLRRKSLHSLRESRARLRGYAWVTVCPAQLAERLGGVEGLSASGAFTHVVPLRAGGVLLQASDTLASYDEQAMRRVFRALAPVLPVGDPRPDPGHPHARVVYENAGDYAG
jgi:hypothetical protein